MISKYSKQTRCVKCGCRKAETEWKEDFVTEEKEVEPTVTRFLFFWKRESRNWEISYKYYEDMIRTCENCGYKWREEPLEMSEGNDRRT